MDNIGGSWEMTRDFWEKRKANKYTQCVGQQLSPLLLINLAGDRFWPTSGHKIEKCCTWPSVPVGRIVWGQYFESLHKKKQKNTRNVNCGLVVQIIKIRKNNNKGILISQKKRSYPEKVPKSKHFRVKQNNSNGSICVRYYTIY